MHLENRLGEISADNCDFLRRVLLSTLAGKTAGWVERRSRHQ
jgi:hypothetical protein